MIRPYKSRRKSFIPNASGLFEPSATSISGILVDDACHLEVNQEP